MSSAEIRKSFLDFFEKRGHLIVPSSSLLPDDPSVLFTTAGMQQFKPYYSNPRLAPAKNVASSQKCMRTSDIDEVGDNSHLTFFEMLGNFSFGGYWKEEAIKLAFEFVTKEMGLEIEYVTIFDPSKLKEKGDWRKIVPEDNESYKIWQSLGVKNIRREGEDNFWGPTGQEGPCGPTTEIYIRGLEIWNLVFNEYYFKSGNLEKLKIHGVDTGAGFERLVMVKNGKSNVFEIDSFARLFSFLPQSLAENQKRIIADHLRSCAFLFSDGILPSNKEQGYILRRLLRRVLTIEYQNNIQVGVFENILNSVIENYGLHYAELRNNQELILSGFLAEREKFQKTLKQGLKEISRLDVIGSQEAFKLYESFGLPYEVIKDVAGQKAQDLRREDFDKKFQEHQEKSRKGQEKKFGGHGLILDTGELKAANEEELARVTKLHTATHLLQAALRKALGGIVGQAGSDITSERLRFDFTFDRKLTSQELRQIEDLVNEIIDKDLEVRFEEMPLQDAKTSGALFFFKEKYPPLVKIYSVTDRDGKIFSKELCGGPHVSKTSEIGGIKIIKEEALAAGVRRIRAVLK